jgi:hypothetical protein
VIERAEALACVLPASAAFSHTTSAQLHGLPLSYAREADERLHVIHRIDRPHLRRANVVGHRAVHARAVTTLHGLRVVGLADTWVDLGELVGRGKPMGLDDSGTHPGGLMVSARIMFVRAGLPEPLPNQAIFASWNPEVLLGYGDLVWRIDLPDGRKVRLIGEYQGAEFHSGAMQQRHDTLRCTRLEDDGWVVIEKWALDWTG